MHKGLAVLLTLAALLPALLSGPSAQARPPLQEDALVQTALTQLYASVESAMAGNLEGARDALPGLLATADALAESSPQQRATAESIYLAAEQLVQNYLALSVARSDGPPLDVDVINRRIASGYQEQGLPLRAAKVLYRIGDLEGAYTAYLAAGETGPAAKIRAAQAGELRFAEPERAIDLYMQALDLWQSAQDTGGVASVACAVAEVYAQQDQYVLAEEHYRTAIENYLAADRVDMVALALDKLAELRRQNADPSGAIEARLELQELYETRAPADLLGQQANLAAIFEQEKLADWLAVLNHKYPDRSWPTVGELREKQRQVTARQEAASGRRQQAEAAAAASLLPLLEEAQTLRAANDVGAELDTLNQILYGILQAEPQLGPRDSLPDGSARESIYLRLLELYHGLGSAQGERQAFAHLCALYLDFVPYSAEAPPTLLRDTYQMASHFEVCARAIESSWGSALDADQALAVSSLLRAYKRSQWRAAQEVLQLGAPVAPAIPADFDADLREFLLAILPRFEAWRQEQQTRFDALERDVYLESLADLQRWTGNPAAAAGLYARLLADLPTYPPTETQVRVLYSLIEAQETAGDYTAAYSVYVHWLEQLASGDGGKLTEFVRWVFEDSMYSSAAYLIFFMGASARLAGHYEQALDLYAWKQKIQEELYQAALESGLGDSLMGEGALAARYQLPVGETLRARAELQKILGNYQASIDLYQQMLSFLGEVGGGRYLHYKDTQALDKSLEVGDLYLQLGQRALARTAYLDAKDLILDGFSFFSASLYIPDPEVTARTFHRLARLDLEAGNFAAALFADHTAYASLYLLAQAAQLPASPAAGTADRLLAADIWTQIGDACRGMQSLESMQQAYEQAARLYTTFLAAYSGQDDTAVAALVSLGKIQSHLGLKQAAIATLKQAVAVAETIQGALRVEQQRTGYVAGHADLYARLVDLLWREDQVAEAFAYAERAQARIFLDQIGNARIDFFSGAPPEQAAAEQQLRQSLVVLQSQLQAERNKPAELYDREQVAQLQAQLETQRREHAAMLDQLRARNPEYASLVSIDTLDLEQVQTQVLGAGDTTLVEYMLLGEHALAWVLNGPGTQPVLIPLDIGEAELTGQIKFLNARLDQRRFDRTIAARLHAALFAPLEPHIQYNNVILVLDGALHYLPFAALYDSGAGRYLVEKYSFSYSPSASVLHFIQQKRNPNSERLLLMADPDGSLPHAAAEAQAIAALYQVEPLLGSQATEERLQAEAGSHDILHLSAHGVYDPFVPLNTSVQLAGSFLTVAEAYGLDLRAANLVVLSACDSDLGEISDGGDVVGLPRAFLYAGTPAVVTTLWAIDSVASGELMARFHAALRQGTTVATALQQAQQSVLATEQWSSPYYWAAFRLTGDALGQPPD